MAGKLEQPKGPKDIQQMGGVFILGPGRRCMFRHMERYPGDRLSDAKLKALRNMWFKAFQRPMPGRGKLMDQGDFGTGRLAPRYDMFNSGQSDGSGSTSARMTKMMSDLKK